MEAGAPRAPDAGDEARLEGEGNRALGRGSAVRRSLPWDEAGWIFAILAVGLLLRGYWAGALPVDPNDGRFDDSVFYHNVAVSLAREHEFSSPYSGLPTAQWPPGYSFFLAGIYWLLGPTLTGARVANMALGGGTAVLVYLLGLQLFERRTARLASLLAAVFPGQIFFVPVLYSEILFTFMFVLGLLLIVLALRCPVGQRRWWLLALGVLTGGAALVRGQGLFLPPMAFVAWKLLGVPWTRALTWTAAIAVLAVAVILPWTVRNYLVLGRPVLITTSFGGNFYMGHSNEADPIGRLLEEYGPLTEPGAEAKVGEIALRRGLQFMLTHPRDEVRLTAQKIRDLYRSDHVGLDLVEGGGKREFIRDSVRAALDHIADGFYFGVLAASGLALAIATRRRDGTVLVPVAVIGLWTAGSALFFGDPRFHFPVIPVFCLIAGRLAVLRPVPLVAAAAVILVAAVVPQVFVALR